MLGSQPLEYPLRFLDQIADSQCRMPKPRLLRLPREIRDLVWASTLLEDIKWNRRHNLTCPKRSRNKTDTEEPPWIFPYCTSSHYGPQKSMPCECARREGLNLLFANRQ